MEFLTKQTFKEKILDFDQNISPEDLKFKNEKPVIIDWFADWCAPCKVIAPVLEELNNEYDEIDFYKINTEEEQELSAMFGIRSIPSLLFIPVGGQAQMAQGALPKETLQEAFKDIFGVDKK
jgi:thioredoxin